jgi:prevent-host-death family protein
MTTLSVSQLRADLADAINRVAYRKERLIVARQGKPLVALIPMEDLHRLEEMKGSLPDRRDRRAPSSRTEGSMPPS